MAAANCRRGKIIERSRALLPMAPKHSASTAGDELASVTSERQQFCGEGLTIQDFTVRCSKGLEAITHERDALEEIATQAELEDVAVFRQSLAKAMVVVFVALPDDLTLWLANKIAGKPGRVAQVA